MRLKLSIGLTYNLGNYQSLRLDVGSEWDISDDSGDHRIQKEFEAMENTLTQNLNNIARRQKAEIRNE